MIKAQVRDRRRRRLVRAVRGRNLRALEDETLGARGVVWRDEEMGLSRNGPSVLAVCPPRQLSGVRLGPTSHDVRVVRLEMFLRTLTVRLCAQVLKVEAPLFKENLFQRPKRITASERTVRERKRYSIVLR